MARTLNILSLDLDWFNHLKTYGKKQAIISFFAHLRLRCSLPDTVAMMTEHHYFYPWCVELLKIKKATKVNVYNVDEHHDFYFLGDIDDFATEMVSCANFFAFMAHHGMMREYHWIAADQDVAWRRSDLMHEFRNCYCKKVQSLNSNHTVSSSKAIWKVLDQKKFDGFAIVKSLDYTEDQDIVFPTVDSILKRYFMLHGCRVGRNACRSNYMPKERPKLNVSNLLPV
jgi:hypothetical protein